METFTLKPEVDASQEFIEIATDFSNPLDVVREALSNSFDAGATKIEVHFDVVKEYGERVVVVQIHDNGHGMDDGGLKSFFDLGNSRRRNDPNSIGEKGHGTKVYFNSAEVYVHTVTEGMCHEAVMKDPFKTLHNRQVPEVTVRKFPVDEASGTLVRIKGYNNNRSERFSHALLKDYVTWFTKIGSFEVLFGIEKYRDVRLLLKGLDQEKPEEVPFGHFFPDESKKINDLFDEYLVDAPDYFCKRILKEGKLRNFPEIKYQAVFSIEGTSVKRSYNRMIRRQRVGGEYTVQDRYGLWLCKDFIPIQRANEWIGTRGTEFTRFHAFFNCQEFHLTANRGSVNNTPVEVMDDIRQEVEAIYQEIVGSEEWRNLDWLESQAEGYKTAEAEKRDYIDRIKRYNKQDVAEFDELQLGEPIHESGVFGLLVQLLTRKPDLFPFRLLDYNTLKGYDLIVVGSDRVPLPQAKVFYVELKFMLQKAMNHSFDNLHSIICWDTALKDGDVARDIRDDERKLKITPADGPNDYTRYYLDHPKKGHKIEVFVLKDYLRQRLEIEFRPRPEKISVK